MTEAADMTEATAAGSGGNRLHADLTELTELAEQVGAVHRDVDRLLDELDAVLGDADAAIGVDEGARAFRSGFAPRAHEIRGAAESAAAELERHRNLIRRGIGELDAADHDVALRLTKESR
ncbi:hypothetical protein [Gordonia aquimaris]|uniref:Uncharacterized protein n=1 Tax=Gordonia aquimaris TaxID=2984863 RepID=A0A9X3D731_9ACTN|nr:hypothetical protein [Gordonia aquimaris]MCX2966083.1 hypothetical protein [Gordonia aquimaris]